MGGARVGVLVGRALMGRVLVGGAWWEEPWGGVLVGGALNLQL